MGNLLSIEHTRQVNIGYISCISKLRVIALNLVQTPIMYLTEWLNGFPDTHLQIMG